MLRPRPTLSFALRPTAALHNERDKGVASDFGAKKPREIAAGVFHVMPSSRAGPGWRIASIALVALALGTLGSARSEWVEHGESVTAYRVESSSALRGGGDADDDAVWPFDSLEASHFLCGPKTIARDIPPPFLNVFFGLFPTALSRSFF